MDAVLRRLPLRDTQEQQARLTQGRHDQYRVVLGHVAGPDLALEQRAPECGECVRVARVEGELVNLQRSIVAFCHGCQPTTRCVHCRIEYVRRPPARHPLEIVRSAVAAQARGWYQAVPGGYLWPGRRGL